MMLTRHSSLLWVSLASCVVLLATPAVAAQNPSIQSNVRGTRATTQATQTKPSTGSHLKKLEPKPVFSDDDQKTINEMAQKLTPEARNDLNKLSDSLHLEDRAVFNELRDDQEAALSDIGMLWQAAVERSGTIRYAIEKLSRRDATGKPVDNDSFTKRTIQSLTRLGGVGLSMWNGTPAGLIGANAIQDIMSGNPQDSALSRVTDADMVILAKEVESLQADVIQLYYNYRNAKEQMELAQEANSTVGRYLDHAESSKSLEVNEALQPLMQSLYESMRQDSQRAQQNYNSAKTALTLKVGPDAIAAMEEAKPKSKASAE
jgi:hypothetical protein